MESKSGLLLSACFLTVAYYAPHHFYFFIFLFLIPLFFLVLTCTKKSSFYWFRSGVLWGVIFFSFHWITFIPLFFNHAHGWFRLMIYPFLVLYASIWTGLWFFVCTLLSKRIVLGWPLGTFLYFYLFEHYALVPFGCCAGYPFANPIILSACDMRWHTLINLLGRYLFLIFLILFQLGCAYLLKLRKTSILCLISLGLLPCTSGGPVKDVEKDNFKGVCCPVISLGKKDASYLDTAQDITNDLLDVTIGDPYARILILPESTFPFCLNHYPEIVEMWTDNILHDDKVLIVGSQYLDGENQLFNTVYFISGGRIIYTYNKKTLMPFTEYIPHLFKDSPLISSLFFFKDRPFMRGSSEEDPICDLNLFPSPHIISICSEFFLDHYQYQTEDKPIVLLINDSWFLPYFQYVMYLYASFYAFEFKTPIIYVASSRFQRIFSPSWVK